MSKKTIKANLESALSRELKLSSQLSERSDNAKSRSNTRRAVEDLMEIKRYKAMHEDFMDF